MARRPADGPARARAVLTFAAGDASLDAFLSVSADSPYQPQLEEYLRRLIDQGAVRPEWCLVGFDSGRPVARAALWALPGGTSPTDIVLIECDWNEDAPRLGTRAPDAAARARTRARIRRAQPPRRHPARPAAVPGERRRTRAPARGRGLRVAARRVALARRLASGRRRRRRTRWCFAPSRRSARTRSSTRSPGPITERATPGSRGTSSSSGPPGRRARTSTTPRRSSTSPAGGSSPTRPTASSPA